MGDCCASIPKVSRDWIMNNLDNDYPNCNFAKHKGYGTSEHLKNIAQFGPALFIVYLSLFLKFKTLAGKAQNLNFIYIKNKLKFNQDLNLF